MRNEQSRGGRATTVGPLGWLLAVLAATALLLSACSTAPETSNAPPTGPQGVAVTGGELRFGIAADTGRVSPIGPRWSTEQFQVARALYDPLVSYDENYVPKPMLAEAVTHNDNFTVWTITVRDGIKFHGGGELDANAVAGQLDLAKKEPALRDALAPISDIQMTSARTVEVRTSAPWSALQHVLASQVGFIAAPPTIGPSPAVDHPEGTGPFTWDVSSPEHLHLKRAAGYWQKGQPVLEGVDFRIVPDAAVRLHAVRSGQLDVAEIHEPDVEARAAPLGGPNGPVQVLTDNSGETPELVIALHSASQPFVSAPARQAVAFGVDREAVSRRIFSGGYPQAYGPYSEGAPWYGQAPWPAWDAGKSRQSALDYTRDTGKPLRFTMLFPNDPMYASLGQLIVDELEAAGIGVTLEVLGPDEVRSRVEAGDYESAVLPLFGGGHPDEDFPLIYGKGISLVPGVASSNYARFRDQVVDESIEKARAVADIGKQADQFQKIQEVLAKEAPYVFLVHLQGSIIASKNVQALTKWQLPDGSPGISQLKTTVALNQVWVGTPAPAK